MKTSQSFGVAFTIKKEKAKDGITNVYATVTINKERALIALKHYVKVENWDVGRGGLKPRVPEAKETNAYLETVKYTLTASYQQLQLAGKEITPQIIKSQFLGEESIETHKLSRLMDYHYETAFASLTWSTLKHYGVTRRYLEKFLREKRNTADIRIIDINYKFIIDFETFLRNHKPIDHQKPMNNNGVMKHLIRLRKMTTLALKLTWISKDPFKNYKFRYKKVETAFLTQAEMNTIQNKVLDVELSLSNFFWPKNPYSNVASLYLAPLPHVPPHKSIYFNSCMMSDQPVINAVFAKKISVKKMERSSILGLRWDLNKRGKISYLNPDIIG